MDRKSGKGGGACGKRGRERLAFAGFHLGQHALGHHVAAHQLDVEVPHVEGALGRLLNESEGARNQAIDLPFFSQLVTQL